MDITQLILDDHAEQRRLFAILEQIDSQDVKTLAAVWTRLGTFLELHAKAEEEIFYPALLRHGRPTAGETPEAETKDAVGDHNDIRDAVGAVNSKATGSPDWYDAIAAVNRANGDHMGEEEREGLTDFRLHADVKTRHELAVAFIAFEAEHFAGVKPVDVDPDKFIAQRGTE